MTNIVDEEAVNVMQSVCPVWTGIIPAKKAIPIKDKMILHAGPPVSVNEMPKAVMNSSIAATIYENWAKDEEQAREMLEAGEVLLRPAQDFNAVVPLASVLSPSMLVVVVRDKNNEKLKSVSTINGGMQHALRLGLYSNEVVENLRWLNGLFGETLEQALPGEGIPLIPIADNSLGMGDDCHGRTIAASNILLSKLKKNLGAVKDGSKAYDYILNTPPFFLNLWMAATKTIMQAAVGSQGSSVITALGGNGIDFGLQIAGIPDRWFTVPATPPDAVYNDGYSSANALGAIGDSAVVDGFGLGAMAMKFAPEQQKVFEPVLPVDVKRLPEELLNGEHAGFSESKVLFGLSSRRIVEHNKSLLISLGVIDIDGKHGRIGGGLYRPPVELFSKACNVL